MDVLKDIYDQHRVVLKYAESTVLYRKKCRKTPAICYRVIYMWKGLKSELDIAKDTRDISVKEIIRECGCSKPHFDKVIAGERKPGKELIDKLSKSLGISEDYINELISIEEDKSSNAGHSKLLILALLFLSLTSIFFIYKYLLVQPESNLTARPVKTTPEIAGDSSAFVKDVTIPDGTYITVKTKFKKIWRIKNSGSTAWEGRYLMRITPFSDLVCHSDSMVRINDTAPGEEVDIEVEFTTMGLPGSCRTDWKMVDRYRKPFFLNKHGLYSIVNVTENEIINAN